MRIRWRYALLALLLSAAAALLQNEWRKICHPRNLDHLLPSRANLNASWASFAVSPRTSNRRGRKGSRPRNLQAMAQSPRSAST